MRIILASCLLLALIGTARAVEYEVTLDTDQEIPAPTLDGATPSGMATVDVDTITGDVSVMGSFAGLTSDASAAHIHGLAPAGANAGVLIGMSSVDAAQSGSFSGSGTLTGGDLDGLLDGQTYLNLHTPNNGPGEIRGQIVDSDIHVFRLDLTTDAALPAPTLDGASPAGSATVVVDSSSGEIEVSGQYMGLTSEATAAHLHGLAGLDETAGVIFPLEVSGGMEGTLQGKSTLSADNLAGLMAGRTYLNLHTTNNGPGEIRAQVPEPTSLVLALGMIALLPYVRRMRR